jgi:class 3 adenylate cyclase
MSQTRRVAGILAADVAGYSRLIGADEEGTLNRLRSIRTDVIDPKITEHRGRIVKTTGDGLLAHLIHREGSGEWRSSRKSRKRRCALRLLHRWDLLSEAGAGGFGTGLVGRSQPRGSRCSGHQSGRDVADEVSIWASSSEG